MANRSFTALARKALLRRGRSILRLRQDCGESNNAGDGEPDFLAGLSESERHELEEIHAALERIERGIFGKCEVCCERIERERLEKLPYERQCARCDDAEASDELAVGAQPSA
jgi:RNA polymerase-binding transcription factor DksA